MTERKFSTHAFLDLDGFEYRDQEGRWTTEPGWLLLEKSPDDLLEKLFLPDRQIWIRSNEATERFRALLSLPTYSYDIEPLKNGGLYRITRLSGMARNRAQMIVAAFGLLETGWGLGDQPLPSKAQEMAFSKYQELFKIKFGYSKGQQGLYLLERFRQKAGGNGDLALLKPEGLEVFGHNIEDLYWSRPLAAFERKKPLVISIDKNSAYPAAASIKLGLVDYTHQVRPAWEFKAGFYRIELDHKDNPLLPPMAPAMGAAPGWYDAPTLRLLSNYGINFEISEAYIWNQESAVLDNWARTLREAASSLSVDKVEDWILRRLIKGTANAAIGKLGRPNSVLYRPDWRNSIIKEHAARIQRDLLSVVHKGIFPCAIYNDEIFFACNADELVAHPYLTDERLSGKYKLKAVYELNAGSRKLFTKDHANLPYELKPFRSDVFVGGDYVFV